MKDPAFLFYSNDFLSGTFTMTDEQVGKYIRLLCIQHQKPDGVLTEKDMLNICKTYDEDIFCKFIKKGDNFYNQRLFDEVERRRLYSKSRSDNRKVKKINTYLDQDMNIICLSCVNHMETITETINITCSKCFNKSKYRKIKEEKKLIFPSEAEVVLYFTENGYKKEIGIKAFNYYSIAEWKDSKGNKVRNWKQKMQAVWFKDENKIIDKKPESVMCR
jgi:hypothetical protein